MREITIFSGSAHLDLAKEICKNLDVPLSPSTVRHFGNDCLYVQLNANCREADVFLIQPLVPPVQEHMVELLFMLDAARGASAARTTAVIPYYERMQSNGIAVNRKHFEDFGTLLDLEREELGAEINRVAPGSARVEQILAENRAAQGRTSEAIRAYLKAAAADPRLAGIHLALAQIYVQEGKPEEARAEIERELAIVPENAMALAFKRKLDSTRP